VEGGAPVEARRPIGRPPASDGVQTRRRLLAAARKCFSRTGYDKTTNKDIATEAGLTPAVIYHYFHSKQTLFVAVWRQMQETVFDAFDRALDGRVTLPEKIKAIMDVSAEMHTTDRSLAAFTAISAIEIQRHEELRRELGDDIHAVYRYFERMVADSAGEIDAEVDPDAVVNMLVAVTTGFAQVGATGRGGRSHGAAIDSFKRLVDGALFVSDRRPSPARQSARSQGRATKL